jgi:hypothetical protein
VRLASADRLRPAGALATFLALVLLSSCGSSIDNTAVGGTLSNERIKEVLGHLFDGVKTVHVDYLPQGQTVVATGAADVIIGPPVQATIKIVGVKDAAMSGSIVVTNDKVYMQPPGFKGKWVIASSADDGVSDAPTFGQVQFERLYLGPRTVGTYRGTETINGTQTRQYVLTATLPGSSSAAPSAAASPTAPITVATVWIDSTGRLIRYTYSPTGEGDWVTATYSKWGEPVTVTAPPAKDITVLEGTM